MSISLNYSYEYAFASELRASRQGALVILATYGGAELHPYYFQGQFVQPRVAARLLRAVSEVVAARFHVPASMLEKILRLRDPLVTSGGGVLRFEGLSGCCSAYVRVDFEPASYRGVVAGRGTTNVDFNAPLLAALSQVEEAESLGVAIGAEEVALLRGVESVVERKVSLPLRWIRSLCEVQAYQSRMRPRTELNAAEALQFLRSLPRAPVKAPRWVVASGRGLRLSPREQTKAVRLAGHERLRVLENLAPLARALRVYADDAGEASEWVLDFGAMRLHLTLSAEPWRGFSGEGQALHDLAAARRTDAVEQLSDRLNWQAELRPEASLFAPGTSMAEIRQAFAVLGSRGLLGFDVQRNAYFHRVLPFEISSVEGLHPRLAGARKLVKDGGVVIRRREKDLVEAEVSGSGVLHRVRLEKSGAHCTCPWFSKHQEARGPCKHILAARIQVGQTESAPEEPV